MAGQFVLMLGIGLAGPWTAGGPIGGLQRAGGWLAILVGATLGIAGAIQLGPSRTAYPRPLAAGRLVVHGVYGRVRHPLYGSLMCLSAGWAALWNSGWAAGLGLALAAWLVAKARREERWLQERYPGYLDYARRVRRFIPWIW